MKTRLSIALAVLACLLPAVARSGGVAILSGAGAAPITGKNITDARTKALAAAKKSAIQAAVALAVSPVEAEEKRKPIERKLLADPDRFLLSYETVRDAAEAGAYNIVIEAKIDLDALAAAIRELPSEKADEAGAPRVLILVVFEKNGENVRYRSMEEAIASRMKMLGLPAASTQTADKIYTSEIFKELPNRHFEALAAAAESFHLGFLVFGMGDIEEKADACPRSLSFYFVDLKSRNVLNRFQRKIGDGSACESAAGESAESIFYALSEPIKNRKILDEIRPVEISVEFRGVHGYEDIALIQRGLEAIPSVSHVRMETFSTGGNAGFRARYEGRVEDLSAAVLRIGEGHFTLRQTSGPEDRLAFSVSY